MGKERRPCEGETRPWQGYSFRGSGRSKRRIGAGLRVVQRPSSKNETPKPARGDKEPEWAFLAEIPHTETKPYLRNAAVPLRQLVDIAKMRWRIERDYQELQQEVGLGAFEGRGWRGFHHHATPCIAAYGFLISERETIPPSRARLTTLFPQFALRQDYQPRGCAVAA